MCLGAKPRIVSLDGATGQMMIDGVLQTRRFAMLSATQRTTKKMRAKADPADAD